MRCSRCRLGEREIMGTFVREQIALVGPDVGRADHLAPPLGFVGDELAEIGG
jgi:hypothetical protein